MYIVIFNYDKITNSKERCNMLEKKELRKALIEKRSLLNKRYKEEADKIISDRIINLKEFKEAKTIFIFVGVGDEINTTPIINHALAMKKNVCTPLCTGPRVMEARKIQSVHDLVPSKFDLLEPKDTCPRFEINQLDLIIVPCLTATPEGYRLGYGGGYYDSYLKAAAKNKNISSAIICYKDFLVDEIPLEAHDMKAGMVITNL